jgi:hypothetical protein
MHASLVALLIAVPGPAMAAAADLGSGAERFAGAPVSLDARLARRSCAPDGFLYGWAGQAVEARCPATGERLVLPLANLEEQPRLKRGETVQADYVGSGFRVTVGAVAEAGGRDGRVTLRNSRSGQRFGARMDQSGRIIVSDSAD